MKRIRTILIALVLSISMLASEFSLLPAVYAEDEETGEQQVQWFTGSYAKFLMTDLYDSGSLVIPDDMKSAIEVSHSNDGEYILLKGKIEDLNALRITLAEDFNFNDGSVGRVSFNGCKDEDFSMSVRAQVYLDNEAEPASEIELASWQKYEDTNGSIDREISGRHSISIGFDIEDNADGKKTTVALKSLQFCKTTVPVMYFNIDESKGTVSDMNFGEDRSAKCYGSIDLVVPDEFNADTTFRDEYGTQESEYGIGLEYIRGHKYYSHRMEGDNTYEVELDKGRELFGFDKNKSWVLLPNFVDYSLVRSRMKLWLGQQLGMEYTSNYVPVEVIMNGEYYGSYLLCEQVRAGEGSLLSNDFDDYDDRCFTTEKGMKFCIESPDDNVANYKKYCKAYTQKAENALFGKDFKDDEGHSYTDYIDFDAAVDYWLVMEFLAEYSGDTFLYKKNDTGNDPGKIYWGPLGLMNYNYEGEASDSLNNVGEPWFRMMKQDPSFFKAAGIRWSAKGGLKEKINEITRKGGRLDQYLAQMETSYEYDQEKWYKQDEWVHGSRWYSDEIEPLRIWLISRTEKVDKVLNGQGHEVKFKINGKVVAKKTVRGALRKSDFPKVPKKKGYVFYNWVNKKGDFEDFYKSGDIVSKDMTLTAKYVKRRKIVKPTAIYFESYDVYASLDDKFFSGGTYYNYTVVPREVTDYTIKWTSSDKSIATVDGGGVVQMHTKGTVTIKATLQNGVSNSYRLHIIDRDEIQPSKGLKVNKKSVHLYKGQYKQIVASSVNKPNEELYESWQSDNEKIVEVDKCGVIKGIGRGTTNVMVSDDNGSVCKVKVIVDNKGRTVTRKGSTYKITSDKKGKRRAMLVKASNAKTVIIPSYIKVDGCKYKITSIKAKAFAGRKASKVIVKTKHLSKKTIKNALKGSKVKRIKINVGKKKVNKQYVKKYKKMFTKKIVGRRVVVQ